jgi:hypothetical protein
VGAALCSAAAAFRSPLPSSVAHSLSTPTRQPDLTSSPAAARGLPARADASTASTSRHGRLRPACRPPPVRDVRHGTRRRPSQTPSPPRGPGQAHHPSARGAESPFPPTPHRSDRQIPQPIPHGSRRPHHTALALALPPPPFPNPHR